jgi:holo-[acyl-carrier protein] synthase
MTGAKLSGLGNDIIEISRIRQSIERHGAHFLDRLFSQQEQDFCYKYQDPVPHFAGRFAAKEAIAKALGTGFGEHLAWHDIEIINDKLGKPIVHLSAGLKSRLGNLHIHVSISHSTDYATAVAIWE